MEELQNFVNNYGFGISVEKLAGKAYFAMKGAGHDVCMINDRYLKMDGVTYMFIKSKKNSCWIVKVI